MEGLQYIFERDSFIKEQGVLKHNITIKVRIDLMGLAEEPDLQAAFDRY